MQHRFNNDAQRDLYDNAMLDNVKAGLVTEEQAKEYAEKKGFPKTLAYVKDAAKRRADAAKKAAKEAAEAAAKAAKEAEELAKG